MAIANATKCDRCRNERDRSYILNEAAGAYLEMYQRQIEEIQKGIAEANAGDFASDEEVKATFARLTNAD